MCDVTIPLGTHSILFVAQTLILASFPLGDNSYVDIATKQILVENCTSTYRARGFNMGQK